MELDKKTYRLPKTKTYLKLNRLFFFCNGNTANSSKWLTVEQELKNSGYNSHKIINKTTNKVINNSIYFNIKPLINGITFFIKPFLSSYKMTRKIMKKKFEALFFIILAIKINNKIYQSIQIKKLNSLEYKKNKLVFYQFATTNIKYYNL